MVTDTPEVNIDEQAILSKFEGEPLPENLIERVYIDNGKIVKHEFYEAGRLIKTVEEVD